MIETLLEECQTMRLELEAMKNACQLLKIEMNLTEQREAKRPCYMAFMPLEKTSV